MAAKVRIEYVRPRLGGDLGMNNDVILQVVKDADGDVIPAELVTAAASVLTNVAPTFRDDGRGMVGGVYGRVTCLTGAAVITEASATPGPATDVNGIRIEAGQQPIMLPIEAGYRFAVVEAAYRARLAPRVTLLSNASASSGPITDLPAGAYLWSMQGTFGGATATLKVLGPDGVNWLDLESMTFPNRKGVTIGENDTVRVFISGGTPSGLYSEMA